MVQSILPSDSLLLTIHNIMPFHLYRFNPFAIVELIAIALTFMMSLITSGIITGGLDNTCEAFEDYLHEDDIPYVT